MGHKLTDGKPTSTCSMRIVGGRSMTMDEYAAYIQALSMKPFLTAHEASTYFNIGINKMYRLMRDPSADFVMNTDNRKPYARIHRATFEKWLLAHGEDGGKEV